MFSSVCSSTCEHKVSCLSVQSHTDAWQSHQPIKTQNLSTGSTCCITHRFSDVCGECDSADGLLLQVSVTASDWLWHRCRRIVPWVLITLDSSTLSQLVLESHEALQPVEVHYTHKQANVQMQLQRSRCSDDLCYLLRLCYLPLKKIGSTNR